MADPVPILSSRLPILEGAEEFRLRTWVQLVRTFDRMHRRISQLLAEHEITMSQFDLLATLRFSEGATQQELAGRLLVTKGNVCGLLDRLERIGWVERRADAKDARANRLHLTPAGRRKIDAMLPRHDVLVLRAMHTLSGPEVKQLRRLLESLEKAVEAA